LALHEDFDQAIEERIKDKGEGSRAFSHRKRAAYGWVGLV
jgi:hypothetical protein